MTPRAFSPRVRCAGPSGAAAAGGSTRSPRRVRPLPPIASERAEQAALFAWLDRAAPPGLFYSATAGGDGRATRTPGYRAGLPDVLLIWRRRPILIEMKRARGGRLSPEQRACHLAITLAGGVVFVAHGWVSAAMFIATIIPLRAKVAA